VFSRVQPGDHASTRGSRVEAPDGEAGDEQPFRDWTVGYGAVDAPAKPVLTLPISFHGLRRAWGAPSGCEFFSCRSIRVDYAGDQRLKLKVLKG